jgi:hypothetical protein
LSIINLIYIIQHCEGRGVFHFSFSAAFSPTITFFCTPKKNR